MSARPLRVLLIEENDSDTELALRELRGAGFEPQADVVRTPEALERVAPDAYELVLADYRLPGWTGLDAFTTLRKSGCEAPFILVSGSLGDERAVECLKQGVADFVLKERRSCLPMAVWRALEQRELREARRRAEEEIARLAAIVESCDDAIAGATPEGLIASWNAGAAEMFGYSAAEAVGRPLVFNVPAERMDELCGALERVRHGEIVRFSETVRLRRDGRRAPVSLTISPIRNRAGAITGVSAIARDVTAGKRLEDQLRRKNEQLERQNRRVEAASRMKNQFLANLSHELRSPLNGIIGFAELMCDGKLGPAPEHHQEYLGDILTSARHLLRLINNVLDLSRVEAGRLEFQLESVSLEGIVREVRETLRAVAAAKSIRVETEVAPEANFAVADASKLKQVLYNYLSNALQFTPEEGRVWVRVLPAGPDHFRLEVEDTGVGVNGEDIGRLFLEFQQLDAGAAKPSQGSGLGLALTKRIVEAQGGEVGVRSTPGEGSLFYALLPRVFREKPAPEREAAADDEGGCPWLAEERSS